MEINRNAHEMNFLSTGTQEIWTKNCRVFKNLSGREGSLDGHGRGFWPEGSEHTEV